MKKLLLLSAIAVFTAFSVQAQRFAYVDSEYILNSIPEYKQAQKQLDDIAKGWQDEIDRRYKEIESLYKAFQAEQVLLTDEMKRQREDEIVNKEKAVKDFQKERFGYKGELFKKRQELVKPIQDRVYEEIEKMAKAKSLDFVFDKSGGLTMLYVNNRHDRSDDVIRALGFTPQSK